MLLPLLIQITPTKQVLLPKQLPSPSQIPVNSFPAPCYFSGSGTCLQLPPSLLLDEETTGKKETAAKLLPWASVMDYRQAAGPFPYLDFVWTTCKWLFKEFLPLLQEILLLHFHHGCSCVFHCTASLIIPLSRLLSVMDFLLS